MLCTRCHQSTVASQQKPFSSPQVFLTFPTWKTLRAPSLPHTVIKTQITKYLKVLIHPHLSDNTPLVLGEPCSDILKGLISLCFRDTFMFLHPESPWNSSRNVTSLACVRDPVIHKIAHHLFNYYNGRPHLILFFG